VIPIAGDQVTNDIAMALRTPSQHAEEIKIRYACALTQLAGADQTIKVPSVGDRPPRDLSRQSLAEVVEPRYDELFTLIQAELRRSGFEDLIPSGVVLTGGTAKMEGAVELAEEIFHMPVRIGYPQGIEGLADIVRNPVYSTAVGLLLYGAGHNEAGRRRQGCRRAGYLVVDACCSGCASVFNGFLGRNVAARRHQRRGRKLCLNSSITYRRALSSR
jgi:cell division protein FtsA